MSEKAVNSAASLEIDTDPFVYAIGARLDASTVVTLVVAREHLHHLHLAVATRNAVIAQP